MATERKPISKRVRFEVFKRDLFRCAYCGICWKVIKERSLCPSN